MKNLIPKSFGRKKTVFAVCAALLLAYTAGLLIYQGTKQTVTLTLNGQEQTIHTHASTVKDVLKEIEVTVHEADYLHPSEHSKITGESSIVWKQAQQVSIREGEKPERKVWTTADTVKELIEEQKIEIAKQDKMVPGPQADIKKGMEISIEKAFPLTLAVGGASEKVWSTSTTVADFLRQQGIKLNKLDRVEPELSEKVESNDTVNVIRVEKVTDVVEEPVPYSVVTKKDHALEKGKKQVVGRGQKGLVSRQYKVIKENGKEVKRILLSEDILSAKKDKVIAVGTKPKPQVTRVSAAAGRPSGRDLYVSATAYTASCNGCTGTTATGFNLKRNPNAKIIAVDPKIIPLGSKVYVEGYGYAVAADKGGAIKGNKIDVFFASKTDAYRWGVKQVKITILN